MNVYLGQDLPPEVDATEREAPASTLVALVGAGGRLATSPTVAAAELGCQIKSRERVRDIAEVFTNNPEVNAMLDLVPGMFPSGEDPLNIDRTFLEPACGSGNFLEEILRRKLAFVAPGRYDRRELYEHVILRCLASIYGIDIRADNVEESRDRLRAAINSQLDHVLGASCASPGFLSGAEAILDTNIIRADALADESSIEVVAYRPGPGGTFTREWSNLHAERSVPDLFSPVPRRDRIPLHYAMLRDHPAPTTAPEAIEGAA